MVIKNNFGCTGLMVIVMESGFEFQSGSLCCILGQDDTLLPQCLSPRRVLLPSIQSDICSCYELSTSIDEHTSLGIKEIKFHYM